jgi:hypothetical protein
MAEQLKEQETRASAVWKLDQVDGIRRGKPTNARFIDCERKASHGNS